MFNEYIKIVIRNFIKYKYITLINILGLSIGIAICIFIFSFIHYEFSYNENHKQNKNIYRVITKNIESTIKYDGRTPTAFRPSIKGFKKEFNEVARLREYNSTIKYKNKYFKEEGVFIADPNILKIFTIDLVEGNINNCLVEPQTIIINKKIKEKYFGNGKAIGELFQINKKIYKIKGVYYNIASNSSYNICAIISAVGEKTFVEENDHWENNFVETFILLNSNVSKERAENKISEILKKVDTNYQEFLLQPLNRIHLYSKYDFQIDEDRNGNIISLMIYSLIGVFILIIASINFINVFLSQISTRIKEISIRKILGANRKNIIFQFLTEIEAVK